MNSEMLTRQAPLNMPEAPFRRALLVLVSLLLLCMITFSWMTFPVLINGEDLLFKTGQQVKEQRKSRARSLSEFLTRPRFFAGGVEVKVLYASETFFAKSDRNALTDFYLPSENYVFFVTEQVHTGLLPTGLADAKLKVNGTIVEANLIEGPAQASHHRLATYSFPKLDNAGAPISQGSETELRLYLQHKWDRSLTLDGAVQPVMSSYLWQLPLDIPIDLLNRPAVSTAAAMALSVGLLSAVLTPCLLQLAVVFLATLGASSTVSYTGAKNQDANRRTLLTAIAFVLGYFVLFTAAGALIGSIGKHAQIAFSLYSRPVAVTSGLIVMGFGIWLGIRSQVPVLCKLPGAKLAQNVKGQGFIGTALVAIFYNLGCMSCFGGAIIATLFLYVGALGSAWAGATMMGAFALGVAIPFLLAALFFTRMTPLLNAVNRYQPQVGLVCAVIIIGFGMLLLTDNFHTFSDVIYPYLSFG